MLYCVASICFHLSLIELLVSSAKADLTLQDAVKNTALHLACSKVRIAIWWHCSYILQQQICCMFLHPSVELPL